MPIRDRETDLLHEHESYWAANDDEDQLIHSCADRVERYADSLRNNLLWNRTLRNWRYFHNRYWGDTSEFSTMSLKQLGEQGKLVGASFNHFRAYARHLITLATEDKESFETQSTNTDQESLDQARLGDAVLENDLEKYRFDRYSTKALEHALILQEGFVLTEWNERKGTTVSESMELDTDENDDPIFELDEDGQPMMDEMGEPVMKVRVVAQRAGEVEQSNPTVFDIARDLRVRDWDDHQWFIVRDYVNRWDLVAQYPDLADQIVGINEPEADFWEIERLGVPYTGSDLISRFTLYHKQTEALPQGKFFQWVDDVPLTPASMPLPYRSIPLRRIVDGEFIMTAMGYSTMSDLQGPQEAYNAETSAICTNHKSFSVQNVWIRTGDKIRAEMLEGQLQVVRSREKPEGLNITTTPAEVFRFRQDIVTDMDMISGVNSVARGQPEANLKSGTALALIDAKSVRFASPLLRSYRQLLADMATDRLHHYNDFASPEHPRLISVTGRYGRKSRAYFQGGSFGNIDRVIVKTTSGLAKTTSGRLEIANMYLAGGLIRMPEELISVLETGQIESLVQAERAQLQTVREENEAMRDGEEVAAMATDYHVLHIREHQADLNSYEVRMQGELASRVLAHIMEHVQLLMDPNIMMLQQVLGFPIGAPLGPMGGAQMGQQGQMQVPETLKDEEDAPEVRPPQTPRAAG